MTSNCLDEHDSFRKPSDKRRHFDNTIIEAQHLHHIPADYERIRVVGRGSFGMAVLYRRKDDESLVILKEINLHELSSNERQLALNEVGLLSRLHHPHIISYYDSFEKDGVLMIEMEYADGGTLAQFLSKQQDLIQETKVVFMFEQMACAVAYLHKNHILHRDLKTANIFLTAENMVKVGDFGISKHMGTGTNFQGAQTILGTPYYLSPEMCKGNVYDRKSDIWALGCCLYEMVCLRKTFDGTSLPVLVYKIINAEYEQVKGPYSSQLKLLLREMLRTDPDQRPHAARVLEIIQRHQNQLTNRNRNTIGKTNTNEAFNGLNDPESKISSAIYQFNVTSVTLTAVPIAKLKVKQLAVGNNHQVLLSADAHAYSWGCNEHGQLGHGDRSSREVPTIIEALKDRAVVKIAVGKSFSVFCVDQGIAMACGHYQFVGSNSEKRDWLKPRIIDSLLRENIVDLACGEEHIVALCENGDVLAWGMGEFGQLGNGECNNVLVPTKVEIPTHQMITNVKCGPDCTLFITLQGTVMAAGSNRYNKLNLNKRIGFFATELDNREVEKVLIPTALKAFRSRVIDADLGPNHSGVLLENGRIHLFGLNSSGELGVGNCLPASPCIAYKAVKGIQKKTCVHLVCGDGYTMVATADNELYFWGSKNLEKTSEFFLNDSLSRCSEDDRPLLNHVPYSDTSKYNNDNSSNPTSPKNYSVILQPTLEVKRGTSASSSRISMSITMSSLVSSRRKVFLVIDTYPISIAKGLQNMETDGAKSRRRSAPESGANSQTSVWPEIGKPTNFQAFSRIVEETLNKICYDTEEERNTIQEILELNKKIQNYDKSSATYDKCMKELEKKMIELKAFRREKADNQPYIQPNIIKNTLSPKVQTKVCLIL